MKLSDLIPIKEDEGRCISIKRLCLWLKENLDLDQTKVGTRSPLVDKTNIKTPNSPQSPQKVHIEAREKQVKYTFW